MTPGNDLRYKRLAFSAITLVVLLVFAASAMTAWGQSAIDLSASADATDQNVLSAETTSRARARCAECGIVESIREILQPGEENDPRATGSPQRNGRNKSARKPVRHTAHYEITIRRRNGESHVFIDANAANWRTGERVSLIEGVSRSSD